MAPATTLLRLAALVGAAFSTLAALDYYGGGHAFCAPGSGCDAVRHSELGQSLGMVLPALGIAGFASVVLLSLSTQPQRRLLAHIAAVTGGIAGAVLLLLQGIAVGAFCVLCIGADLAAMVGALAALPWLGAHMRRDSAAAGALHVSPRVGRLARTGLLLALGAPTAWVLSVPRAEPAYVASFARPGKIHVVEFSDFECPYCRALHPELKRVLEPLGERVHFVRKSFPLPGHRHARTATRAYLCAQSQGAATGEAMAHALFTSEQLDAAGGESHARTLGLDLPAFRACVADADTDARIDADMEAIRGADFHGLPTVWIGGRVLEGFDPDGGALRYEQALEAAAGGDRPRMGWAPWVTLAALALMLLGVGSRRRDDG